MLYLFIFYLLPTMFSVILGPKFLEYNEGLYEEIEVLVTEVPWLLKGICFMPIANIFLAGILILWYVLENINKTNCGE